MFLPFLASEVKFLLNISIKIENVHFLYFPQAMKYPCSCLSLEKENLQVPSKTETPQDLYFLYLLQAVKENTLLVRTMLVTGWQLS